MRSLKKVCLPSVVFAALLMVSNHAWAIGFGLGETKEELELDYEVSAVDHGTGRVSVTLMIADPGRLGPLDAVYLSIPSEDGTNHVDLSIALDTREVDGGLLVHIHLKRELAERGEIRLRTSHLDGKQELLTWYYHAIPIAEHLPNEEQEEDEPAVEELPQPEPAPPASPK